MSPQSLWPAWPALRQKIQAAGRLALFLDYDGVLVPIAPSPSDARLPAGVRRLLGNLADQPGVWVAVVSGRRVAEVKAMVGLPQVCYAGNHGLELQGPKLRYTNPTAVGSRPLLQRIALSLRADLRSIPGAWVEDKGLSLSVHYRKVAAASRLVVRNRFYEVLRPSLEHRQVRVTAGKRVFEVRPPVQWTKGTVVQWLLARQAALAGPGPTLPLYVGDDDTDEDAFRALRTTGLTIVVGDATQLSRAHYRVKSPLEVRRWLRQLLTTWRGKVDAHAR